MSRFPKTGNYTCIWHDDNVAVLALKKGTYFYVNNIKRIMWLKYLQYFQFTVVLEEQ